MYLVSTKVPCTRDSYSLRAILKSMSHDKASYKTVLFYVLFYFCIIFFLSTFNFGEYIYFCIINIMFILQKKINIMFNSHFYTILF